MRRGIHLSGRCACRHWQVVTADGHTVTGRQEPRLVLVSLTCEGGQLCLSGPDMEELRFPIDQPENPVISCRSEGAQTLIRPVSDLVGTKIS